MKGLGAARDAIGRQLELWREREHTLARARERAVAYDASRLTMGRHSYGDPQVVTFPGDTARVQVGAFCSIAMDVTLMDGGNHRPDWITTFPLRAALDLPGKYEDGHPSTRGDIVIGNDVWIGRGARILSGVTIGNGAVVGGYAVVAKSVRPYAIVVGNPAREVRRRFTDAQVEALERVAWWEWADAKIVAEVARLSSGDVDGFIAAHDPAAAS